MTDHKTTLRQDWLPLGAPGTQKLGPIWDLTAAAILLIAAALEYGGLARKTSWSSHRRL